MNNNKKLLLFASACLAMAPTTAFGQVDSRAESPSAPPLATEFSEADKALNFIPSVVNNFSVEQRRLQKDSGREVDYALPIRYTTGHIYNPATDVWDKVSLRSYGKNLSPGNLLRPDFVAPTVLIKPGQTVRFKLSNKLPAQPDCAAVTKKGSGTINTPHCFNTTNMHTHGLWISPAGNSDNVLLRIQPGVDFEYEYNVPIDHPAGTFWYHPHTHGSTAMQVGSGMAGALLIQGDREPTPTSNGDLDTLLRPFQPPGGIINEVKLFQQIPYACFKRDASGKPQIETEADGTWKCEAGQIGVVEDFDQQMGRGTWAQSGRHTLINGFARNPAQPLVLEAGKVHRWRLIDAGVREPIALRIRKIVNTVGMENAKYATRVQQNAEAQRLCNDPNAKQVSQFEVAADGLTRSSVFEKSVNTLQPGYRSDILFALPEKGYYCVFSDPTVIDLKKSDNITERNANVLTIIKAVGNQVIPDQKSFIQAELIRAAGLLKNKQVGLQVQADLRAGLQLTKFVPHPTVTDQEIKASNLKPIEVAIGINQDPRDQQNLLFQVNRKSYDPKDVNPRFQLILGKAQEWVLRAENFIPPSFPKVQHPFHIHVNPFQIVKIIDDKTGSEIDVSEPQYAQYRGVKGTWKDTIMLTPGLTIHTRTRYQRYIGEFVLHCHILDHEDQGMMANVEVVLPDAQGGAQSHGHH
jgi:hypothetical protein